MNSKEQLQFLIRELLAEHPQYENMKIPEDEEQQ